MYTSRIVGASSDDNKSNTSTVLYPLRFTGGEAGIDCRTRRPTLVFMHVIDRVGGPFSQCNTVAVPLFAGGLSVQL